MSLLKAIISVVAMAALGAVMASPASAGVGMFQVGGSGVATATATATGLHRWLQTNGEMKCEVPPATGQVEDGDVELILPLPDNECDAEGYEANVDYEGCALTLRPADEVSPGRFGGEVVFGNAPGETCSALVTGWPYSFCETNVPPISLTEGISFENVGGEVKEVELNLDVTLVGESNHGFCGGSYFEFAFYGGWRLSAENEGPQNLYIEDSGSSWPETEATDFEAQFGGTNSIAGAATAEDAPTLSTGTGTLVCDAALSGTLSGQSAESLDLGAEDSNCSFTSSTEKEMPAELVVNGCDYDFSVDPESVTAKGDLELSCAGEKSLEYVIESGSEVLCRFELESQEASAVEYSNTGSGYGTKVEADLGGVKLLMKRTSGKFLNCGSEKQEWASSGSVTLSATNTGKESGLRVD